MRVQWKTYFQHGGVNYEPDDFIDLTPPEAEDFIKRGLVKKFKEPKPKLPPQVETAESEVETETAEAEVEEIETEMMEGAPEHALSRRGRRGRRPRSK